MTLMTIADSHTPFALGSASEFFSVSRPCTPLKTLLSIAVAWICRCNKIAAAIFVTLHDVVIWAMPAIYFAEYHLGCWSLHRPGGASWCVSGNLGCTITWIGMYFRGSFGLRFGPAFVGSLFSPFVGDHRLFFDANAREPERECLKKLFKRRSSARANIFPTRCVANQECLD